MDVGKGCALRVLKTAEGVAGSLGVAIGRHREVCRACAIGDDGDLDHRLVGDQSESARRFTDRKVGLDCINAQDVESRNVD